MILNQKNLGRLRASVSGPNYDRSNVTVGIVHIGPGAFHRAHQAVYTDDLLLSGETEWGICDILINSARVRDILAPQDNLYTLTIRDQSNSFRVIGAIQEILVAPEDPKKVIERLAMPSVKVVTLTVTEKGYCLTPEGGLDCNHKAIVHDLTNPDAPKSAVGFIVAGLRLRKARGISPFVPLSCDNITDNGHRLARAVQEFAYMVDPAFGSWVAENVRFPRTMVDSITPATTDDIRESVSKATGLDDGWPVQRERFTQWVIEDLDDVQLPPWHDVGAILTKDVGAFEATKLRVLNCLHSSLAFLGMLEEFETVEDAVNSAPLRAFVERMLADEIIPGLPIIKGLDKVAYGESVLERFRNPAIRHLLSQIAWDSSQKIPFRILGTIEDNIHAGKASPNLCFVVAAWMRLVCKMARDQLSITDPLADQLTSIASKCDGSARDVRRFFKLEQIFPASLISNRHFQDNVIAGYLRLEETPVKLLLRQR